MIKFETLQGFVDAHQRVHNGEELVRQGLEMIGNDSNMYFEDATDYWTERMIDDAIGEEAMEALSYWMWDCNMGTDIPDNETMSNDLETFYIETLVPAIMKHYTESVKV